MKLFIRLCIVLAYLLPNNIFAQPDTTIYHLTLREEKVNKAGKNITGMTINGNIPGPTLRFTEGDYAIIYVKNEMKEETSVHWHGILLPNFYDGVPYLNTPPIMPGETQKYEFPLKQSGTYWYHSHTLLQEQSGVYGSIVIQPEKKSIAYDKELVMVLSDWTNQKPKTVLRFLKRGTEFYSIKKGTAIPLNQVIARGALGAQINFWKQRMEGADIADIYYDAFLVNGKQVQKYTELKPGEKVRLRIINGSASTAFWMTFGGVTPILISSDGLDVEPVEHPKTYIGVAETYDFLVTVPENNSIEFRAMAQDGSGHSTVIIGQGAPVNAEKVPKPDKIVMMQKMAKMDMRMGAPAAKFNPQKNEPHIMMKKWGMQMNESMNMDTQHQNMDMDMNKDEDGMGMYSEYGYDYLKSPKKTNYNDTIPVKEVLLNLTGNMNRYVWSMNGIPLSETDKIKINAEEITRITINNLTMMHHPMHLHGHFFRVLNKNGEYSPLKHTVNVPPMDKVTIEFYGNEYGDWFFHCHILYHMMGGMARIFSYDTPRDPRLEGHPVKKLKHEMDKYYSWGMVDVASHFSEIKLVSSNIRNQFNLQAEYGWNEIVEAEFTYQRYLFSYLSVFGGVNAENEEDNPEDIEPVGIVGIRYFTPYMFNLDVRIDHQLRPQVALEKELMIFPRTILFGEFEYQADFGLINELENEETGAPIDYKDEITWNTGLEFLLTKNFALNASYDNRFGFGGGLSIKF